MGGVSSEAPQMVYSAYKTVPYVMDSQHRHLSMAQILRMPSKSTSRYDPIHVNNPL